MKQNQRIYTIIVISLFALFLVIVVFISSKNLSQNSSQVYTSSTQENRPLTLREIDFNVVKELYNLKYDDSQNRYRPVQNGYFTLISAVHPNDEKVNNLSYVQRAIVMEIHYRDQSIFSYAMALAYPSQVIKSGYNYKDLKTVDQYVKRFGNPGPLPTSEINLLFDMLGIGRTSYISSNTFYSQLNSHGMLAGYDESSSPIVIAESSRIVANAIVVAIDTYYEIAEICVTREEKLDMAYTYQYKLSKEEYNALLALYGINNYQDTDTDNNSNFLDFSNVDDENIQNVEEPLDNVEEPLDTDDETNNNNNNNSTLSMIEEQDSNIDNSNNSNISNTDNSNSVNEKNNSTTSDTITDNNSTNENTYHPILKLSNETYDNTIKKYTYTIWNQSGSFVTVYKDTKDSIPYIVRYPNGRSYIDEPVPEKYKNSNHKLYFNEEIGTFYFSDDGSLPSSIETLKKSGIIMYVERTGDYLYIKYYMIKESEIGYDEDAIKLGYDLSIFGKEYE